MSTTLEHNEVVAENLGPIKNLSFALEEYGLTVLVGANGSGKSTLLNALQASAKGTGKLPLRDRAAKGKLEAFGASITIAGTTRHKGKFEVTNLEGRFDLSELVDPLLKTPSAADAKRIKALVSLTGVKADADRFRDHKAFKDFDDIVDVDSLNGDDFVEMARMVKAAYDRKAKELEAESEREAGHAEGLKPQDGLDLSKSADSKTLSDIYDGWRDTTSRLHSEREQYDQNAKQVEEARENLERMRSASVGSSVEEIGIAIDSTNTRITDLNQLMSELEEELATFRNDKQEREHELEILTERRVNVEANRESIHQAEVIIDSLSSSKAPTDKEIQHAEEQLEAARLGVERGALIRKAIESVEQAKQHQKLSAEALKRSEELRKAGRLTDEVLSSAITCDSLRIESDGDATRLVVDHPHRGDSIPFHELSEGERWKIAIDLGADQVGEDGLLVIPQAAFEGLDAVNRQLVHDHAIERKVFVLTAEAAREGDSSEITAKAF